MAKLINAPHLKEPWNNQLFSDLIILAGSTAWGAWNKGKGTLWHILADTLKIDDFSVNGEKIHRYDQKPVILDVKQLASLGNTRLCNQDQRFIKIFQYGELTQEQKTAICLNLATNNKVNGLAVGLYDGVSMEKLENLSGYIERLRTQESEQETAKMIVGSVGGGSEEEVNLEDKKPTSRQKVEAFLKWKGEQLARDLTIGKSFIYNGKAWEEYQQEELERDIVKFYNENNANYTQNTINSLAKIITLNMALAPKGNGRFIAFENGVIDKYTGEFLAHHQSQGVRGLEPFNVNLSENTPHFDDWLDFVSDGDQEKRRALLSAFYMVLTNKFEWGLFVEAVGVAGSGKSVFAEIATIINGRHNTAVFDIDRLEDANFLIDLVNKSLAISPDQNNYKGTADGLKRVTGGDAVIVRPLYKQSSSVKLNTVIMITTNYPLLYTDRNGGVSRRRVIIVFDKPIPPEKKDVRFTEKVASEVYGIIRLLLKTFPDERTAQGILENYREHSDALANKTTANHLTDFAQEFYVMEVAENDSPKERAEKINGLYWGSGQSNKNETQALYNAYIFYCRCQNITPLNVKAFKQALPDALKETGQKAKIQTRLKSNSEITNIYFKNTHEAIQKWLG
ncbi:DNA primase family protein [Lonepinella sp. BR2474]|uniref:DNA primase family protein n=1 Tax=Lonepinella sp. BR2474 TaxID=3434548 RepID=UPI003F6E00C8